MVHKTDESPRRILSKWENVKPLEFKRQQAQYEDLTADFKNKSVDFSKQFCHIYAVRLAELRDALVSRVNAKWSKLYVMFFSEGLFYFIIKVETFNNQAHFKFIIVESDRCLLSHCQKTFQYSS